MALFEDAEDPLGGATLEPSPALATTGPTTETAAPPMPLPDLSAIVASAPMPPRMAVPPPVGPPPHPMQDPRQRLLALFTTMFALGAGPGSAAGAGALRGLNLGQQALQKDQEDRWKYEYTKTEQERQRVLTQQAIEDRQAALKHEQVLAQNVAAFQKAKLAAKSKEEYDRLADAFGNGLQAMGYRITPNWFRSQIPYMAPTRQQVADDAYQAFMKIPSNADYVNRNPEKALAPLDQGGVAIAVDLNGDGVKEQISLADLGEMSGHRFARDKTGALLVAPKAALTGTTPFVVAYNQGMDEFVATNHRQPNTQEKGIIYKDALEKSKEKPPESDLDRALKVALLRQRQTDKLVKVEHQDPETGRTVIEWLPESEVRGKTFAKGVSGATESRLASAQAVNDTANDIIANLRDPVLASQLGPAMGRYNTLRDFIGDPPPEFAELAGMIESFSLANMGVHGMRSAQGAEKIKKMLDQRHTPASLIREIQGLTGFSRHFMQNEGRTPKGPVTTGGDPYEEYLKRTRK